MAAAAERLAGTGHRNERVVASAAYLAEHLAEVPPSSSRPSSVVTTEAADRACSTR
jgi:hypothetical protein